MLSGAEQEDSTSSCKVLPSPFPPTTPPLADPQPPTTCSSAPATVETEKPTIGAEIETVPTGNTQLAAILGSSTSPASQTNLDGKGKRTPRQWDAWTHEEEETFFIALRHFGKNFEMITSRVQTKNKDQVRHYYYRLIRRINKLLAPDFSLDAKNTKDANTAMLRWWSLLEKESCSASKLYLKPRRFKTFVTALEQQIMKDRVKASKKCQRIVSGIGGPVVGGPVLRKLCACVSEATKSVATESLRSSKLSIEHGSAVKQTMKASNQKKKERSQPSRKRKKGPDDNISAAEMKKWEKAASAGVSLVAEAAEQLERAAAEELEQVGSALQLSGQCTTNDMEQETPEDLNKIGSRETTEAVGGVGEEEKKASKLKLQLYPIDEGTRKCMEEDGLNPYLELTLKPRKAISSVIRHLSQKWGRTSAAEGQLHLFPYTQDSKNISNGQCWSIEQTACNAGDLFAALGNPSVLRLRYAWIPCRVSQPSHAECSQQPVCSSMREDMLVEVNLRNEAFNGSSKAAFPKSKEASVSDVESVRKIFSTELLHASAGILSQEDSSKLENIKSPEGKIDILTESISDSVKAEAIGRQRESLNNASMPADVLIQVDARNAIRNFGQGSPIDKLLSKPQENRRNLGSSWLYDGSNDSFAQRVWAAEDAANGPILPTEIDWVDSLTNISVSEFLNDISQAGHLTSGTGPIQAVQPLQSLDSFDAAVAAQNHAVEHRPETPAWDGEETRDAFTFRKFVSQKLSTVPTQCGFESQNLTEPLKESDAMVLAFADCGSLEAWRQSFGHTELGILDDPKSDSSSRFLRQQLVKGNCSQDFIFVDSLSLLSTGPQILGTSKEEQFLSRFKSIGATARDPSLDALQTFGDSNCSPAASCGY